MPVLSAVTSDMFIERTGEKPGDRYCRIIAAYLAVNYASYGIEVHHQVTFGKTVIAKDRKIDILLVRRSDGRVMALECKWQDSSGTTDEKIPYALSDLRSLPFPGCLVYGGDGFCDGIIQSLKMSGVSAKCLPGTSLERDASTRELDQAIGAVFGIWELIVNSKTLFNTADSVSA